MLVGLVHLSNIAAKARSYQKIFLFGSAKRLYFLFMSADCSFAFFFLRESADFMLVPVVFVIASK